MESNLNNSESPVLQKATLRDEHGYIVLPRTLSSAITIDEVKTSNLLNPGSVDNNSVIQKPITLNNVLEKYSSEIGIARALTTTVANKSDIDHLHENVYLTRNQINDMIVNAKLPEITLDESRGLVESLDLKVDKIDGKGLSTNDFTDELKARLIALSADDIKETEERLFMKPIERLKLARLDNSGRYRISYNDLLDKPDIITQDNIADILSGGEINLSKYALKDDLNDVINVLNSKSNIGHVHDEYTTESEVRTLISTISPNIDLTRYVTTDLFTSSLNLKSDKDHIHAQYTDKNAVNELIADAFDDMNISDLSKFATKSEVMTSLSGKVDKIDGKGLSTNDFTNEFLQKLTNLEYYIHPASHPASMITGLSAVATSGSYTDLANRPYILTVEEVKRYITEAQLENEDGSSVDLSNLQATTSNELNTESKSIVGAINELESEVDIILTFEDRIIEAGNKIVDLESNNIALTQKINDLQSTISSLIERVRLLEETSSTTLEIKLFAVETRYEEFVDKLDNITLIEGSNPIEIATLDKTLDVEERITNLNLAIESLEDVSFALIGADSYKELVEYNITDDMDNTQKIETLSQKLSQLENLNIILSHTLS